MPAFQLLALLPSLVVPLPNHLALLHLRLLLLRILLFLLIVQLWLRLLLLLPTLPALSTPQLSRNPRCLMGSTFPLRIMTVVLPVWMLWLCAVL